MMEGPRHQHLHQEWQEPLEEPDGRLGAANDGSAKVIIVVLVVHSHLSAAEPARAAPLAAFGRHLIDEHVKAVAQEVAQDVSEDAPQDLAFFGGPGGARPPRHATTTAAAAANSNSN